MNTCSSQEGIVSDTSCGLDVRKFFFPVSWEWLPYVFHFQSAAFWTLLAEFRGYGELAFSSTFKVELPLDCVLALVIRKRRQKKGQGQGGSDLNGNIHFILFSPSLVHLKTLHTSRMHNQFGKKKEATVKEEGRKPKKTSPSLPPLICFNYFNLVSNCFYPKINRTTDEPHYICTE